MARISDYEATEGEAQGRGIQATRDPVHFAGVEPQTIPANGEITFTLQPNMDMNPHQIVVPDAFAPSIAVTAANIGPVSIAAGDGPMPGDAFRAESTMRFRPALPITQGQPLKVRVRNLTASPIAGFYFGVIGSVRRSV